MEELVVETETVFNKGESEETWEDMLNCLKKWTSFFENSKEVEKRGKDKEKMLGLIRRFCNCLCIVFQSERGQLCINGCDVVMNLCSWQMQIKSSVQLLDENVATILIPSLVNLSTRANKVFVRKAHETISILVTAIVESNHQGSSICISKTLHLLSISLTNKNKLTRLAVATAIQALLLHLTVSHDIFVDSISNSVYMVQFQFF